MARVKDTIMQRDFSGMEVRAELLEGDDTELRKRSLQTARNLRPLSTRILTQRPGTYHVRDFDADNVVEITPADGTKFGLVLRDDEAVILNDTGGTVATLASPGWTSSTDLWVQAFRRETLIGDPVTGIYRLLYTAGVWSLATWEFTSSGGGDIAQPYWVFNKGSSIKPSARTGTITVTAQEDVFTPAHVGTYIRYGQREILVTSYVTSKSVIGDVVSSLPPSFSIEVADVSEYRVGETVVGADTNYQGVIGAIDEPGKKLKVTTINFFEGPDAGELLSSGSFSSEVVSVTEVTPRYSTVWDEQLMSAVHGWPRSAAAVSGRLFLCDFPEVPSLVVASSSRSINDFRTGSDDDDAISREVGDDKPRFLHTINAGDLILLSDSGCYFVQLRDGTALTPANFHPVRFDRRGANMIPPVLVDDAVVFIEANGKTVSAAVLSGNVYLKWTVRSLTLFHNHLVTDPVALCGPSTDSPEVEKYLFVVNADGTLAAVSWFETFGEESIGLAPWDTDGDFVNVMPLFGAYWTLVDRAVTGGTVRMLERFDVRAWLDSAIETDQDAADQVLTIGGEPLTIGGEPLVIARPSPTHLPGKSVSYMFGDSYAGDYLVGADGVVEDEPDVSGARQIGLNFTAEACLWPVEVIESPRVGTLKARVYTLVVSMKDTIALRVRCNGKTRDLGGFSFGDAIDAAPPRKTKVYRIPVFGNRDHPDLAVIKHIPGPWTLMATGQEVQG